MPIKNRFAELHGEITEWRRDFHAHPELLFDTHRTAARVAELLGEFGADEVVTGIGRTGVVGVIRGRTDTKGRVVGLRADMDALPIHEETGLPYASGEAGKMHACGHDGHTAMLLGAAKLSGAILSTACIPAHPTCARTIDARSSRFRPSISVTP